MTHKIHYINDTAYIPQFVTTAVTTDVTINRAYDPDTDFDHPLQCKSFVYERTLLGKINVDVATQMPYNSISNVSTHADTTIERALANFIRDSKCEWAIIHSFDGLHVTQYDDPMTMSKVMVLHVYLQPKHATFWRLHHQQEREYN